ncbi:hypothetical protein AVEN_142738-1 [Araneus ventricosus]|uniref:Uncharacterized protein n=1 Tax=Araneus ventricosus TaxID=182803 RepID=A0A4Y2R214_ARAVE|nr:hypothetical protein AVEN_269926-1 [Araneus ventricosus]GBN69460.1 hypothetical protein AVEN_142738-1 [Araneus ventricosus]
MVFPMNCCAIFHPVLTSVGVCYSLKDNQDLIEISKDAPVERPFIIDLPSPSHPEKGVEQGFNVFLTDPKDIQNVFTENEGQKIVPGFVTTISAHLIKRQRTALHTAWHGGSTNCPTLFGSERFTYKTCFHLMTLKDQKDIYNCTPLLQADEGSGFMLKTSVRSSSLYPLNSEKVLPGQTKPDFSYIISMARSKIRQLAAEQILDLCVVGRSHAAGGSVML